MSTWSLTPESFLKDVAEHELIVLRDDGVSRHIRLKKPGTVNMHFELITWAGHLCYTGDMGTFVFERLEGMFQFFRRPEDRRFQIDKRYWAEKVIAEDRGDGVREFDPERFKRAVSRERRRLLVKHGREWSTDKRRDFWEDIQPVIDAADDSEHAAIVAVQDWSYPWSNTDRYIGIDTSDFPSCKRFTDRFIWCCYALSWGIAQYDAVKEAVTA